MPEATEPTSEEALQTTVPESGTTKSTDVALASLNQEARMTQHESAMQSAAGFAHWWRIAKMFAASSFIPDHFRNKPGDCLIAIEMANRMGEDPLMLMQQSFMVSGRPGWSTQFMIARANTRAGFKSKIRWRIEELEPARLDGQGRATDNPMAGYENIRVVAYSTDQHGEVIEGEVDTHMAIGENWIKNNKYQTMFRHMMRWRAAAFLIRLYAPEVMMGMLTTEEMATLPVTDRPAQPLALMIGSGAVELPNFEKGSELIGSDEILRLRQVIKAGKWDEERALSVVGHDGDLESLPSDRVEEFEALVRIEPAPEDKSDDGQVVGVEAKATEPKDSKKGEKAAPKKMTAAKVASLRRQAQELGGMDETTLDAFCVAKFDGKKLADLTTDHEAEVLKEIRRRADSKK